MNVLFFPPYKHNIHVSVKQTQWERTGPVFPGLAAGREEKKFLVLQAALPLFHVSQTTHLIKGHCEVKDYKSTQLHVVSLD